MYRVDKCIFCYQIRYVNARDRRRGEEARTFGLCDNPLEFVFSPNFLTFCFAKKGRGGGKEQERDDQEASIPLLFLRVFQPPPGTFLKWLLRFIWRASSSSGPGWKSSPLLPPSSPSRSAGPGRKGGRRSQRRDRVQGCGEKRGKKGGMWLGERGMWFTLCIGTLRSSPLAAGLDS